LMVIVSVVVVAYEMHASTGPPTYSLVSSSSTTNAGSLYTFSVLWTDDVNLSGYVFETNNTGVFVNDTWTPFFDFTNQTSAYSSVMKTLNNTAGNFVNWRFWCNDTSNRWTALPMQGLLVVSRVLLETSSGDITIQLFGDTPITTGNFMNLIRTGVYDGTNFSRIVPGFVIQGGDASVKGITVPPIQDELPNKHSNVQWTVAMAKASDSSGNVIPNSATDQFYINLEDNSATLDGNYTVFGTVISGMSVVDSISQLVPSSANATGYDGPPSTPVMITTAQFVS